jgi:malonyl-CoA/methylmalonyl-CoA synthetase
MKYATFLVRRKYSDLVEAVRRSERANASAIVDSVPVAGGNQHTIFSYKQLYDSSKRLALYLHHRYNLSNIKSIGAYSTSPQSDYVTIMLATWMLGKVFVPLSSSHSIKEIEYFVQDSNCNIVVHNISDDRMPKFAISQLSSPNVNVVHISSSYDITIPDRDFDRKLLGESSDEEDIKASEDALVLYTSGTTGKPKGVLHTQTGLRCMVDALVSSWKYSSSDVILHFLPLHHLHGVLNKLLCMLHVGGTVRFLESSSSSSIWKALAAELGSEHIKEPTIFMAVPTVYAKMIESVNELSVEEKTRALTTLKDMRLHVSGSAALPDVIMDSWQTLTGHMLLERYGMSELGMVLSNPYEGKPRRKGSVGFPMPYIAARIVDDDGKVIDGTDTPGELRIKGPTVFKEYLNRPETTNESFDEDVWFRTGDIALRDSEGYYRLLGRSSTDIIKVWLQIDDYFC